MIMNKISYALSLVYNIDLDFKFLRTYLNVRAAERMARFLALLPDKFKNGSHIDLRINFYNYNPQVQNFLAHFFSNLTEKDKYLCLRTFYLDCHTNIVLDEKAQNFLSQKVKSHLKLYTLSQITQNRVSPLEIACDKLSIFKFGYDRSNEN